MYIRWDITQHVFVILLTFMIKKKKSKNNESSSLVFCAIIWKGQKRISF